MNLDNIKDFFNTYVKEYLPYKDKNVYRHFMDYLVNYYYDKLYNTDPIEFKTLFEQQLILTSVYNQILIALGMPQDIIDKLSFRDKIIILNSLYDFQRYKASVSFVTKIGKGFDDKFNVYELYIDRIIAWEDSDIYIPPDPDPPPDPTACDEFTPCVPERLERDMWEMYGSWSGGGPIISSIKYNNETYFCTIYEEEYDFNPEDLTSKKRRYINLIKYSHYLDEEDGCINYINTGSELVKKIDCVYTKGLSYAIGYGGRTNLAVYNNKLYMFRTEEDENYYSHFFVSIWDGTNWTDQELWSFPNPAPYVNGYVYCYDTAVYNNKLWVSTYTSFSTVGVDAPILWSFDGTTWDYTVLPEEYEIPKTGVKTQQGHTSLVVYNNKLYVLISHQYLSFADWQTDITWEGIRKNFIVSYDGQQWTLNHSVNTIPNGVERFTRPVVWNDRIYMIAGVKLYDDDFLGNEIWRTNGTLLEKVADDPNYDGTTYPYQPCDLTTLYPAGNYLMIGGAGLGYPIISRTQPYPAMVIDGVFQPRGWTSQYTNLDYNGRLWVFDKTHKYISERVCDYQSYWKINCIFNTSNIYFAAQTEDPYYYSDDGSHIYYYVFCKNVYDISPDPPPDPPPDPTACDEFTPCVPELLERDMWEMYGDRGDGSIVSSIEFNNETYFCTINKESYDINHPLWKRGYITLTKYTHSLDENGCINYSTTNSELVKKIDCVYTKGVVYSVFYGGRTNLAVYNNKLYMFRTEEDDQYECHFFVSIWDGTNWTDQELNTGGNNVYGCYDTTVYNNKLWLSTFASYRTVSEDIPILWSFDGTTWDYTVLPEEYEIPKTGVKTQQGHTSLVVYNNKLYVLISHQYTSNADWDINITWEGIRKNFIVSYDGQQWTLNHSVNTIPNGVERFTKPVVWNGYIYMIAAIRLYDDEFIGNEIWRTNGTLLEKVADDPNYDGTTYPYQPCNLTTLHPAGNYLMIGGAGEGVPITSRILIYPSMVIDGVYRSDGWAEEEWTSTNVDCRGRLWVFDKTHKYRSELIVNDRGNWGINCIFNTSNIYFAAQPENPYDYSDTDGSDIYYYVFCKNVY